jgi:ABC-type amino acid transport substrate-binding protein
MLESKRADYAVFPRISTLREIKKMGYSGKIDYLKTPITSQSIYIAISKKSPIAKKIDLINKKISEYIKDGTYERLRDEAYDEVEKISIKKSH